MMMILDINRQWARLDWDKPLLGPQGCGLFKIGSYPILGL